MYVLQNYLFLSESYKNDFFGKGDRGFQIFYQSSSLMPVHYFLFSIAAEVKNNKMVCVTCLLSV